MKTVGKISRPAASTAGAIAIGVCMTVLISVLLVMGASALLTSGTLAESNIAFITYTIMFIAVFFGTIICSTKADGKVAIIHMAVAAIYLFILATVNIICFDGTFRRLWAGFAAVILSTAISLFITAKGTKQKKRYKSPYR